VFKVVQGTVNTLLRDIRHAALQSDIYIWTRTYFADPAHEMFQYSLRMATLRPEMFSIVTTVCIKWC
jgi:hypothetical protein